MPFDLTLVMLFCTCTVGFFFRKVKRLSWKALIFISVWLSGLILSFTIGYFVGEYNHDKYTALKYSSQGFWLSLFGCLLGIQLARLNLIETDRGNPQERHNNNLHRNLRLLAFWLNIMAFGAVIYLVLSEGIPSHPEEFILMILFVFCPIINLIAIFPASTSWQISNTWLALYIKRKKLEEKERISSLESKQQ